MFRLLLSWIVWAFRTQAISFWTELANNDSKCYWIEMSPDTMVHIGAGPGHSMTALADENLNFFHQKVFLEVTEQPVDAPDRRRQVYSHAGTDFDEVRFTTMGDERNPKGLVRITMCVWYQLNPKPGEQLTKDQIPLTSPVQVVFDVGPEAGDHTQVASNDNIDKLSQEISFQYRKVRTLNSELSDLRHRDFTSEQTTDSIYSWVKYLCIANVAFLVLLGIVEVYSFKGFLQKKKII